MLSLGIALIERRAPDGAENPIKRLGLERLLRQGHP